MAHRRPRCVTATAERRRERAGIPDSDTWEADLAGRLIAVTLPVVRERAAGPDTPTWREYLDAIIADADRHDREVLRVVEARRTLQRVAAIDLVWHRRGGRMHYDA